MDNTEIPERIYRSQTKEKARNVLSKMNAILQKMPISEAVKDKRYDELQTRLNSLGWLGLCDEATFTVKGDGPWTQLRLVDPESDEARKIP